MGELCETRTFCLDFLSFGIYSRYIPAAERCWNAEYERSENPEHGSFVYGKGNSAVSHVREKYNHVGTIVIKVTDVYICFLSAISAVSLLKHLVFWFSTEQKLKCNSFAVYICKRGQVGSMCWKTQLFHGLGFCAQLWQCLFIRAPVPVELCLFIFPLTHLHF